MRQEEGNCLCNIASSWIISLSLGAKKKESTNFDALCICEGDCVSVENHGKHWIHLGNIISIDKNTKTAVVKWEETRKKDTVHLGDCKKYNKLDVIRRKWKSTDFFCEIPQTKRGKPPPGHMKNTFFGWKLVKVMRWRCHWKLTEHVAFFARRYNLFLGIGHIRFVHTHEIIEWVTCSQGCFNTKFRNRFDSEVPVYSM